MKDLYKKPLLSLLGLIAIGAVIAAGLTGCEELLGGGDNTDPKTLVITDIPSGQGQMGVRIGIFPVGTTPQQALAQTGIVAGADSSEGAVTLSGSTATAKLYVPSTRAEWTGSGTYDMYVATGGSYYRVSTVPFTSASTRISATDFVKVDPNGNGDNNGNSDKDGNGGGKKPAELSSGATFDETIAKLDEIIAYSGAPANAKADARNLKDALKSQESALKSTWSYAGAAYLTPINALIATIPGNGDNGNGDNGNGDNNGNSGNGGGAKNLVITDIPSGQGQMGVRIGIFPVGTTPQQALAQTGIVAGADSSEGAVTLSGSTATAKLYVPSTRAEWIGSGTYDMYVATGGSYYRVSTVPFTSASTRISATDFVKVDPNGNGDNNGNSDKDGNGGGKKPAELSSGATFDETIAKLDEIIAYSGAPANAKADARNLKDALKSQESSLKSAWSYAGAAYLTPINALIATIPGNSDGGGQGGQPREGYHWITFVLDDEGTVYERIETQHGRIITEIPAVEPTKDGYRFVGWVGETGPITEDTVFTAQWEEIKKFWDVIFMVDGVEVSNQRIMNGGTATPPVNDPTKTGWVFDGWEGDYTNVTGNVTVTAKWKEAEYNVTFFAANGGYYRRK